MQPGFGAPGRSWCHRYRQGLPRLRVRRTVEAWTTATRSATSSSSGARRSLRRRRGCRPTARTAGCPGCAARRSRCWRASRRTTTSRLERGNLAGVSEQVLESIADALQLDEAERHAPAGPGPGGRRRRPARNRRRRRPAVPASVQAMLDGDDRCARRRPQRPARHPGHERPRPRAVRRPVHRTPTSTAAGQPRPVRVPRRARARLLGRLGAGRRRHRRHPARSPERTRTTRRCHDADRRAVHAQRGVPRRGGPATTCTCTAAARRRSTTRSSGGSTSCTTRCRSPRHPA